MSCCLNVKEVDEIHISQPDLLVCTVLYSLDTGHDRQVWRSLSQTLYRRGILTSARGSSSRPDQLFTVPQSQQLFLFFIFFLLLVLSRRQLLIHSPLLWTKYDTCCMQQLARCICPSAGAYSHGGSLILVQFVLVEVVFNDKGFKSDRQSNRKYFKLQ